MKTSLLFLLGCLVGPAVRAQEQAIDWWTLDGGGATSTGGIYAVTGTVGQPDAGTLEGETYTVVGGFWSIVAAIQTPGAPRLEIMHTNGLVVVSWRRPATGFVLDHTPALGDPALRWFPVELPYVTNATHISVVAPISSATGYYRLRRP
jgi:hypothetical protein